MSRALLHLKPSIPPTEFASYAHSGNLRRS